VKRRRWIRLSLVLALTGAAIAALIGPVSSAVGFFSPPLSLDVRINSPATLVARGAAVDVPLEVVCTSRRAEIFVQVRQRAGSEIAQGDAFTEITCEGDIQEVTVTVFANGGKAFRKGTGVAEAQIFGCIGFCGLETDTAEVQIARR
jgi:hypothetical protein